MAMNRLHRTALGLAALTGAIGLFALGTWQAGAWEIATFGETYIPMAPTTALLFVVLAAVQASRLLSRRSRLARGFEHGGAIVVALVVFFVLLQVIVGFPLPWDRWFRPAAGTVGVIPLGQMAPLTAGTFLISALAIALQDRSGGAGRFGAFLAAAAGLFIGVLVAAGYAAGTPISYSGDTVPMALLTALGFIGLNLGSLLSGAGVALLRRWLLLDQLGADVRGDERLTNRLLVATGLGLVVLIVIAGFYFMRSEQAQAREAVRRELRSVADLKLNQIVRWRQERLSEGRFLQRTPAVVEDVAAYLAAPGRPEERARLDGWLEPIKGGNRYEQILLFDAAGELRYALPEGMPPATPPAFRANLEELRRRGQAYLTDLYRGPNGHAVQIGLLVPISGPDRAPLATLLLVLDPAETLFGLVQSWPVPSETAEAFLVRREGEVVVYLNELRHQAGSVLMTRSVHEEHLPAAMAARGRTDVTAGRDYRGRAVITVSNSVPDSAWWLIAKIDQEEVYASVRLAAWKSGLMVACLVLTVGLGVGFIWRQRHAAYLQHTLTVEHERAALSERLATVMRYANDIILLLDDQGRIVEGNDRALTAYGYTLDELRALPPGGLRAPAASGNLAQQLDALLQARGGHFETTHRRKDGTEFAVEVSGRAVELGGRRYGLGIYRDISERRAAEAALRASEEQFRAYVEQAADALFVHDGAGRILDVNRQACASLGYSREELLAMNVFDLEQVGDAAKSRALWDQITPDSVRTVQGRHKRRDGTAFPVEVRVGCFDLRQERRYLALVRDTSERAAFEHQIERFNHLYAALSQVNQAIVHAPDRAALLQEICRALVHYGRFRMAWIGLVDPATRDIRPAARYGDEFDYVGQLHITTDDRPEGRGPTGTAAREGRTVVIADIAGDSRMAPWHEAAMRSGLRSSIAMPIRLTGEAVGVLTVYASEPDFFGPEEIALLEEAAMDVAFGLDSLTKDERRQQMELTLRSSEERFRTIFKHAPVGISLTMADDGSVVVNDEHVRITGVSEADSHRPAIFKEVTHPDDLDRQMAMAKRFARGEIGHYTVEKRYLHPDGRFQWAELTSRFYIDPSTNRRVILTILIDIAARKEAEARLQEQLDELRRWHQATLGREDRILELKREVNELLARLGQAPRYPSAAARGGLDRPHV